ncbi:MAG: DUF4350 domain-containing protein [Fimbriiglobus sp.]
MKFLATLLTVVTFSLTAHAQTPLALDPTGSEVLQGLLRFHGFAPITIEESKVIGGRGVTVIVIDPPGQLERELQRMAQQTPYRGGSVLVAADQAMELGNYAHPNRSEIRILGNRILSPYPGSNHERIAECPYLEPHKLVVPNQDPVEFLLSGLNRVATNNPSTIQVDPEDSDFFWRTVADLPTGTLGQPQNLALRTSQRKVIAANVSGGGVAGRRLMFMADPGILSNQMLVAEGTDNLAFANNLVLWLKGMNTEPRCVFVKAGKVITNFDTVSFQASPALPNLPTPPMPDLLNPRMQARMTDFGNEMLAKIQDEDRFNTGITKKRSTSDVIKSIAVIVAGILTFFLLRHLLQSKHQPETTQQPKEARHLTNSGDAGSLARKKQELLEQGDYSPLVREYLQHWFERLGASGSQSLPKVEFPAGHQPKVQGWLQTLWDVAYTTDPRPLPLSRWKQLEPMIQNLQSSHADQAWRFVRS